MPEKQLTARQCRGWEGQPLLLGFQFHALQGDKHVSALEQALNRLSTAVEASQIAVLPVSSILVCLVHNIALLSDVQGKLEACSQQAVLLYMHAFYVYSDRNLGLTIINAISEDNNLHDQARRKALQKPGGSPSPCHNREQALV